MLEYVTKLLEVPPIYEPFTPSITTFLFIVIALEGVMFPLT